MLKTGSLAAVGAIVFAVCLFQIHTVYAAINEQIPFYGTLQDTVGVDLSGSYDMVFRFYDAPSGGTLLDTSTHTVANGNPVTVTSGEFSAMLGSGSGNVLDGIDFNIATIYVGVTIGTDSEMTPRERLGSVAYAFNADMVDGYDSLDLLRLNETNTISASASTPLLTIRQNGTGDILNILDGVTEVFTIIDGGNVGIGNTAPGSKLSITGDISVSGAYRDTSGDAGTAGQVLLSTLTGTNWTATSSLGFLSSTAGNWSGTFDGQEGTFYLANSFSTTSANYWETAQGARNADNLTDNSIEDLQDVGAMTENYGDLLFWNGSAWADIATSSLGITATLGNNSVTPNNIRTTGQTDEYCLTYESTGSTWEWQTCGGGGSLFTDGGATTYLTSLSDNLAIGSTTASDKLFVAGNLRLDGSYVKFSDYTYGSNQYFYASTSNWTYAIGDNAAASSTSYGSFLVGYRTGMNSSASYLIALGDEAAFEATGSDNIALGRLAGYSNTGNDNLFFGSSAGYTNTGTNNFIAGKNAGILNSGSNNIILGEEAGSNTNSSYNILLGSYAGYTGTTGPWNIMIGEQAGRYATDVWSNVLIGAFTGAQARGQENTFVGNSSGGLSTGNYNEYFGAVTGTYNRGSYNQFVGYFAGGYLNSTSTVAIGTQALMGNNVSGPERRFSAINNVALGYRAGYNATNTASNNILIGYQVADNLTTGNNNIIIGYDIDNVTATADNRLNIGNLIFGTGLDGTGTTLASGNIGIGTSSPASKLSVAGDLRVTGVYRDTSGDAGTSGQVLLSTLTGTNWTSTSSLGITATLGNNSVTPNNIRTTGQTDEYCLTYESTGSTWEWQTCGGGGSLFTDGGATTYLTSLSDNLAIGTTTSTEKLTVVGNVDVIGDAAYIAFSGTPTIFASSTIESVAFGAGTGNGLSIYSWGLTYIGHRAGENASSSVFGLVDSTFVGTYAGFGSEVNQTSLIGAYAGYQASGFNNNIIGYYAGYESVSDSNNILGYYTGYSNTGEGNNIIGYESGYNNGGFGNDIIGYRSGYNNIGDYNVLLGADAGYGNRGEGNVAIGRYAGYDNKGLENVMFGWSAGYDNTGTSSVMIGTNAGFYNRGLRNSFVGYEAGFLNYGDYTAALGFFAGGGNQGDYNSFLGVDAGAFNYGDYNNFIGYQAGSDENEGDFNDFIGYQAGEFLNSTSTVAIGGLALQGGTTNANAVLNTVAIGYGAGSNVRSGANNNIFVGYNAADNITTGDNNIIIGYNIDHISAALSNRLNIGNLIFATGLDGTGTTLASGNVGIGTSTPLQKLQVRGDIRVGTSGSNGCLENYGGGVIGGTCSSDEDLKTNIVALSSNESILERLVELEPVTYNWNNVAATLYSKDSSQTNFGLIAQDVEQVFPELVTKNDDEYRQVNFSALPFYMLQAIKELWMKVTGLEEKVKEIDELRERIERLEQDSGVTYQEPSNEPNQPPESTEENSVVPLPETEEQPAPEVPVEEPPTESTPSPEVI